MAKFRLFFTLFILTSLAGMFTTSCGDDDNVWDDYKEWRIANEEFYDEQRFLIEDGANVYQTVIPSWNPLSLIHI